MRTETCLYCLERFRVEGRHDRGLYCSRAHRALADRDEAEARRLRLVFAALTGFQLRAIRRKPLDKNGVLL